MVEVMSGNKAKNHSRITSDIPDLLSRTTPDGRPLPSGTIDSALGESARQSKPIQIQKEELYN